ncbi:MAG: flagellar basal body rod C-terminal domain-containing protein [Aquificota bacterium]|nr:flagellar basal body rod C-terminal domain-containing protein [Aquificota bacterium]
MGIWSLPDAQKVGEGPLQRNSPKGSELHPQAGLLELSNVNPILEMVRLIETSRT